jgi:hypothetical protein
MRREKADLVRAHAPAFLLRLLLAELGDPLAVVL